MPFFSLRIQAPFTILVATNNNNDEYFPIFHSMGLPRTIKKRRKERIRIALKQQLEPGGEKSWSQETVRYRPRCFSFEPIIVYFIFPPTMCYVTPNGKFQGSKLVDLSLVQV